MGRGKEEIGEGLTVGSAFDVVLPIGAEPLMHGKESWLDRRSTWWLEIFARLKPGQSLQDAQSQLRAIQPQIREATLPPDWRAADLKTYLREGFERKSGFEWQDGRHLAACPTFGDRRSRRRGRSGKPWPDEHLIGIGTADV